MRLVACTQCHAQFDVTHVDAEHFQCHCGTSVENLPHAAVDAEIRRCGSCGAAVTPEHERCAYCDSIVVPDVELSLVCPECYARNADSARFCVACGVAFEPQPVLIEEDVERPCPVCAGDVPVLLLVRSIAGVRAFECGTCHGLWVPGEAFDRLVERAIDVRRGQAELPGLGPKEPRPRGAFQSNVVYRKCPECAASMQRKNFARISGVIVDWCGAHGTWLDADELENIAGFILEGGLAATGTGGGPVPLWRPHVGEGRARAMAEAEKIMATEKIRLEKKRRRLVSGADEGDVLETIGSFLSKLLG